MGGGDSAELRFRTEVKELGDWRIDAAIGSDRPEFCLQFLAHVVFDVGYFHICLYNPNLDCYNAQIAKIVLRHKPI